MCMLRGKLYQTAYLSSSHLLWSLARHPSSGPARAKRGCESHPGRAHGEVADEVPYKSYDLDDGAG
jgi:hypothetical protein